MAIIRVVGAPATGKTMVRRLLGEALGLPSFGIDDERLTYGWSERAWPSLAAKVRGAQVCIVETSGTSPNDARMMIGHPTFTILCLASRRMRERRLQERVEDGYTLAIGDEDYVKRLLAQGVPHLRPHFVVSTDRSFDAAALIDRCREFVESNVVTTEAARPAVKT